jgi:hypothetical protein
MENAIKILHAERRGQMLDMYERFHIYEIGKQNIQLNDNFAETYNPIYAVIITAYRSIGNEEQQPDLPIPPHLHTSYYNLPPRPFPHLIAS